MKNKIDKKLNIPLARPWFTDKEPQAASNVIRSEWLIHGKEVEGFERQFAKRIGTKHAIAVNSGSAALLVAQAALGISKGDEVIVPDMTFISTATSCIYLGARPVFADIDLYDYCISPDDIEKRITKKSKAIIPVHYAGQSAQLSEILQIAKKYNLVVIEDACEAHLTEYDGKKCGSLGIMGTFSFTPTKPMTTGEGGMLTTNNPDYDQAFRLLRQHGMSVSDAKRHRTKEVIFESYLMTGYNYRMTDIQAAIGIEQLKRLPQIVKERRRIGKIYHERLKDIPWLTLTKEPSYCKTNWQSYPLRVMENAPQSRDDIMQYLLDAGVATRRGIMNAHQEKPYHSMASLVYSEKLRDSVILLPLYFGMADHQIDRVTELIKQI